MVVMTWPALFDDVARGTASDEANATERERIVGQLSERVSDLEDAIAGLRGDPMKDASAVRSHVDRVLDDIAELQRNMRQQQSHDGRPLMRKITMKKLEKKELALEIVTGLIAAGGAILGSDTGKYVLESIGSWFSRADDATRKLNDHIVELEQQLQQANEAKTALEQRVQEMEDAKRRAQDEQHSDIRPLITKGAHALYR